MIEYHIPVHSLCHPNSNTPETGQEVQQRQRQTYLPPVKIRQEQHNACENMVLLEE